MIVSSFLNFNFFFGVCVIIVILLTAFMNGNFYFIEISIDVKRNIKIIILHDAL